MHPLFCEGMRGNMWCNWKGLPSGRHSKSTSVEISETIIVHCSKPCATQFVCSKKKSRPLPAPNQDILSCTGACPSKCKMIAYVLANFCLLVGFRLAQHVHGPGTISHAIKSPGSNATRPRVAGVKNMAANWRTLPMGASVFVESTRPLL